MPEYINSNDDAGNMGLYAGIGLAAFAGGAALAYRATSPIYKDGVDAKNGNKGLVMKYDDMNGKKPASFFKGALRGSTLGLVSKGAREKGLSEMSQAVMDTTANRMAREIESGTGLAAKKFGVVSNAYNQGLSNLGSDIDKAQAIINGAKPGKKAPSVEQAIDQVLEQNPNSLVQAEDVQKRLKRAKNQPLTQADREAEGLSRYAELQAKAQEIRENGGMTDLGKKKLQDEWLAAKDAHEAKTTRLENAKANVQAEVEADRAARAEQAEVRAAEKAVRKDERMARNQQRNNAWEQEMLEKHAPYKETKELLKLNPTMPNEAIRAQVPNAGKIQDVVDVQRLRAQQKHVASTPDLQQRLTTMKGIHKEATANFNKAIEGNGRKSTLERVGRELGVELPKNVKRNSETAYKMYEQAGRNELLRKSAQGTVLSTPHARTGMGGAVITGNGNFQKKGRAMPKAARKAAMLARMLGH